MGDDKTDREKIDWDEVRLAAMKEYHKTMASDLAHFILGHFEQVNGYIPYGFHKHCRENLLPIVDKLMNHEANYDHLASPTDSDNN